MNGQNAVVRLVQYDFSILHIEHHPTKFVGNQISVIKQNIDPGKIQGAETSHCFESNNQCLDPVFPSDPSLTLPSLSDPLLPVEVKGEKQRVREMHRSASTPRVSDDYSKYHSSPPPSSSSSAELRALSLEADELLPVLEPMSEVYKKEKSRIRFGETAVHVIPFVLLFCALVLWFFSNPDIDVPIKPDSVAARVEGLTLEGELDTDSSQTGVLAGIDLGDLDPARHAM